MVLRSFLKPIVPVWRFEAQPTKSETQDWKTKDRRPEVMGGGRAWRRLAIGISCWNVRPGSEYGRLGQSRLSREFIMGVRLSSGLEECFVGFPT